VQKKSGEANILWHHEKGRCILRKSTAVGVNWSLSW